MRNVYQRIYFLWYRVSKKLTVSSPQQHDLVLLCRSLARTWFVIRSHNFF